jgi:hypothetical protein
MNTTAKWTMALALTMGCGSVLAATTYTVNFTDGSETITGSIVTAGNTGLLSTSDLESWNLTGTGPVAFTDQGSGPADASCQFSCQLTATATTLSFTPTGPLSSGENLSAGPNETYDNIQFSYASGVGVFYLNTLHGGTIYASQEGYTPGVIGTAPVPLPASAWLMLSGLGGFGALARKRRAA